MGTSLIRVDAILGNQKPLMQHIIAGDDMWLWIDAGIESTPAEWILPELERRGLTPPAKNIAVITHADVDHFGGMFRLTQEIPGMVVIAHESDRNLLESIDQLMSIRYDGFASGGIRLPDWRNAQLRERAGAPLTPSLLINDELAVSFSGAETWRIIHLPGHSAGHLGVWNAESQTLIAGDAVMGWGVIDGDGQLQPPHYVDVDAYRATIRRLLRMDLRELRLSHEEVMRGESIRDFLIDSFDAVELLERALMSAMLTVPADSDTLLLQVCEDVKRNTDRWETAIPSAFAASIDAHLRKALT
jgi:glyoxylase-like metal-dependent hydrolase (beta-lactamase superfamily II)